MLKFFAGALVATAAVWFVVPAPANAAPRTDGIQTTTTIDLSAHRRSYRHTHRAVRVYRAPRYYPAPRYYGYYGPTYYERPYAPPPPIFFGFGGRW